MHNVPIVRGLKRHVGRLQTGIDSCTRNDRMPRLLVGSFLLGASYRDSIVLRGIIFLSLFLGRLRVLMVAQIVLFCD